MIGAVAVGLGVIGFVAANWDGMSHAVRLVLLTGAVAGSYASAYHLRERTGSRPRVGEALYLLGVVLFGASLFLVGQMYNVQAHDPLALLLWSGGASATALVVRSRAVAATAVLIFTAWVGFEFGLALDDAGGDAFAAFPVVAVFYGGALYGLATAAQARIREHWFASSGFPESCRGVGLPVAAAGLFVFTFSEAADELAQGTDGLDGLVLAGFVLLAVLAFAGAGALALSHRPSGRYEGAALAAVLVTMLVAMTAGGNGDVYALVFNVLFAAVALGVIYAGYLSDEPWLVNLGVVVRRRRPHRPLLRRLLVGASPLARDDRRGAARPRHRLGARAPAQAAARADGGDVSSRRRLALVVVVCVQLALPLALAGLAAADLAFGEEIRLQAEPVDPVDVFRGNYVVLRYEISSLPVLGEVRRGDTVCARLQESDGVWRANYADPGKPTGTVICGRARNDASPGESVGIEYGIETYYASAERAREIEESIAQGDLYAVIDLDADGSARIKRLEGGG